MPAATTIRPSGPDRSRTPGASSSADEAMARFVDRTGRPGPATWEVGRYPDGDGDLPVHGVSWYEAAAYASVGGQGVAHGLPLAPRDRARRLRGDPDPQQLRGRRSGARRPLRRVVDLRHLPTWPATSRSGATTAGAT